VTVARVLAVLLAAAITTSSPAAARPAAPLHFAVTYRSGITDTYTGRVYVMLSTSDRGEPREGPSWFRPEPFFALDVEDWKPETPLVFDDQALGYPGPPASIEAGTWRIQAVMRCNLDSPTVGRGRGDAVSGVLTRRLDGATAGAVELVIDRQVGEPQFQGTDDIKLIETRSAVLSAFHGRDIMLRAAVILPPGYDDATDRYPALYLIGGFASDHRLAPMVKRQFESLQGAERVCIIVPDPRCRTGHHAFADSDNNGPWGRAFTEELVPAVEHAFKVGATPAGRFLTGVSSGGWSSLWLQVTHPDFFGGTWSVAPDPVDFRSFQGIDIYAPGVNVYTDEQGNPRPIARMGDQVMLWFEPFARMEWVMGDGGQLGSFEAVFGPRGAGGHPARLFDRATGAVDPAVAAAWKRYDIRMILEAAWPQLEPKLAGKVSVFVGDQDNFYLDRAVGLLKAWQESVDAGIVVEILPGRNHATAFSPALRQRVLTELLETYDRHRAGDD
jgi:hypothetical protein